MRHRRDRPGALRLALEREEIGVRGRGFEVSPTVVRPGQDPRAIAGARRRSSHYGIDATTTDIPFGGDVRPAADKLRRVSAPVLDDLLSSIADSSIGVVLADKSGHLARREAANSATLRAMATRSIEVGFSLAEVDVGTNGVGTCLETKSPVLVVGDDHHLESFHGFTCANAPIFDPISRRVEGTVGVLCPVDETGPLLLSTALQLSDRISSLLLEQASPEERRLLDQFLRHRRSSKKAIATMSEGVMIATPPAQRLLAGVDHGELWQRVESETLLRAGSHAEFEFDRPTGGPLHLRCRPMLLDGAVGGATIEFVPAGSPSSKRSRRRGRDRLGDLVGVSDSWNATVREAFEVAHLNQPVLVVGEQGTGKMSIARAITELGGGNVHEFDSAEVLLDGDRQWVLAVRAALTEGAAVILRRVDRLSDNIAASLASVLAAAGNPRVLATTIATDPPGLGSAALVGQLDVLRVTVAPLRDRRDDIAPLVTLLSRKYGGPVQPQALSVLYRHSWPGNVTEVDQALRSAYARSRTSSIGLEHLPKHIRSESNRRPLHGLRQKEAAAIIDAIESTPSRVEAARLLGISRATLYRRIEAYGIDV